MSAFALVLVLAAAPPAPRVYDPHQLEDLVAIARVLRTHVVELHVEVQPAPDDAWQDEAREGYGVVIGPRHVATLSFNVERAKKVMLHGPSGKPIEGKVVLDDVERRVSILESKLPLANAGLVPAAISPKDARVVDARIFALVSTGEDATVVHGVITHVGEEPEYGGHHRVDLKLTLGMPVFDDRARFAGYSRAVAWDKDKLMLVTPELIKEARTATAAAAREQAKPKESKRPWWSK